MVPSSMRLLLSIVQSQPYGLQTGDYAARKLCTVCQRLGVHDLKSHRILISVLSIVKTGTRRVYV